MGASRALGPIGTPRRSWRARQLRFRTEGILGVETTHERVETTARHGFPLAELIAAGFEVVPKFRTPHLTYDVWR